MKKPTLSSNSDPARHNAFCCLRRLARPCRCSTCPGGEAPNRYAWLHCKSTSCLISHWRISSTRKLHRGLRETNWNWIVHPSSSRNRIFHPSHWIFHRNFARPIGMRPTGSFTGVRPTGARTGSRTRLDAPPVSTAVVERWEAPTAETQSHGSHTGPHTGPHTGSHTRSRTGLHTPMPAQLAPLVFGPLVPA